MLQKILRRFFGKKNTVDHFTNKLIAVFFVLFQAMFLVMLLDSEIFKASAQNTVMQAESNNLILIPIADQKDLRSESASVDSVISSQANRSEELPKDEADKMIQSNSVPEASQSVISLNEQMAKTVKNEVPEKISAIEQNYPVQAAETNLSKNFSIEFIDPISTISLSREIVVSSGVQPESVNFLIEGPKTVVIDGKNKLGNQYYFFWNLDDGYPEGEYRITASARKSGVIAKSYVIIKYLKNGAREGKTETIFDEMDTEQLQKFQPTAGTGSVALEESVIGNDEKDSEKNRISPEAETVRVIDANQDATNIPIQTNEQISSEDNLRTEKRPISFSESSVPKIIGTEGENISATSVGSAVDEDDLSAECIKAGIQNGRTCQIFQKLDPICKNKGFTSTYQCSTYLEMDSRCRSLGLDESACNIFLRLSADCQSAGKTNQEECESYLYEKALPAACKEKNITNHKECNDFLFTINFPAICVSAGIKANDECAALLVKTNLNQECRNAGINLPEECEKHQKNLHEQKQCASLGLLEEEKCTYYLQKTKIAPECLNSGFDKDDSCSLLLWEKYGRAECLSAGIENDAECAAYLFNKYRGMIDCKDMEEWQCHESVKNEFLSDIAHKQAAFSEIISELAKGERQLSVGGLLKNLDAAKYMIPLASEKTGIKLVRLKERIVLDASSKILQTAPAAVMIDADGDGLSDDAEKRIGTNTEKSDSDNDGYSDWDEVKNNFNPLGTGSLISDLPALETAIANGYVLEQPRTEGIISESIKIEEFINTKDSGAYLISGKSAPGSVVTLFLYSDIPVLVSAQTDEFGNWQYEFTEPLADGEHEIYAVINDNTGRIVKKSNFANFFIREAKAVSLGDFTVGASKKPLAKSESMLNIYLIVSLGIALSGIMMFVAYVILRKNKQEDGGDQQ